jgi:predicted transcriptional regulator
MFRVNPERKATVDGWEAEMKALANHGRKFTVAGRREQVVILWEAGFSQREIAKSTGSTRRTIRDDLAFIVGAFAAIIASKPPTLSKRQLATMKRILWHSPSCVEEISKIDPGYVEEQKRFDQAAERMKEAYREAAERLERRA